MMFIKTTLGTVQAYACSYPPESVELYIIVTDISLGRTYWCKLLQMLNNTTYLNAVYYTTCNKSLTVHQNFPITLFFQLKPKIISSKSLIHPFVKILPGQSFMSTKVCMYVCMSYA